MKIFVPPFEEWKDRYRQNPYLRGQSVEVLQDRFRYLFENIMSLRCDGKAVFNWFGDKDHMYLLQAFVDTYEELKTRGWKSSDLPQDFLSSMEAGIPKPTYPNPAPGVLPYSKRRVQAPGRLFKYGQEKYLGQLVSHGILRICHASKYNDPSLNSAIKDNELEFTLLPKPGDVKVETLEGEPIDMQVIGFTIRHPVDYYVSCFSRRFAPRLFGDFGADCCVVIYDPKAFLEELCTRLAEKIPMREIRGYRVHYLDPHNPQGKGMPIIPFTKHIRFTYQAEFRIAAHPWETSPTLEEIDLELRLPTDCLELIRR